MANTTSLRFDGVYASYGPARDILADVRFSLQPGSLTILTGPSGAGKTTLLRLAYLAMRPTRGKVVLLGADTSALSRSRLARLRRRIGVVFQEFRLLNHLSAYENAALPLRVAGQTEKNYRDDVIELLRWVGLGSRLRAKPNTLSGGEQQRVAIARAVVGKPDLLIADEPTGNVDPEMASRLARLFEQLNARLGMTVLVATHDADLFGTRESGRLRLVDGMVMRGTTEPES